MGVTRISNNKYKITIELGYDILGNRKRKTLNFTGTKQEAIKKEAELKSEFYHIGKAVNINDLTFEEYSQIFLEKYCKDNISLVTISGYKKALKKILPLIGKIKLNKISPYILDSMYQKLRVGVDGRQLGYHSQYGYYKLINVMINQAIRWEIMDKNPNLKATKPKKEHKEKKFYDEGQVKKLLDVLENEPLKYRLLIKLALDSGARRSEICALRWSDIDFNTNSVRIDKSLKVVEGIIDEKTTKTESSKREIILSQSTIDLLNDYKDWQKSYIKNCGKKWQGTNRIFTSKDGSYMHPSTCDQVIRKIVKKYNLDHICFHELRHTCASLLINMGIDPKTVSKRLGHSDSSITMEIYTHAFESSKKACADKFDELMKNMQNE